MGRNLAVRGSPLFRRSPRGDKSLEGGYKGGAEGGQPSCHALITTPHLSRDDDELQCKKKARTPSAPEMYDTGSRVPKQRFRASFDVAGRKLP